MARRALGANEGTEYEADLRRLTAEIEADRNSLIELLGELGHSPDRVKVGAAWAAEKAGRLKLNGALRGYSPRSRVTEIEGLRIGVLAKRTLWQNLRAGRDGDRIGALDLAALERRADAQADQLAELLERAFRAAYREDLS